jgi:hypothetical protein
MGSSSSIRYDPSHLQLAEFTELAILGRRHCPTWRSGCSYSSFPNHCRCRCEFTVGLSEDGLLTDVPIVHRRRRQPLYSRHDIQITGSNADASGRTIPAAANGLGARLSAAIDASSNATDGSAAYVSHDPTRVFRIPKLISLSGCTACHRCRCRPRCYMITLIHLRIILILNKTRRSRFGPPTSHPGLRRFQLREKPFSNSSHFTPSLSDITPTYLPLLMDYHPQSWSLLYIDLYKLYIPFILNFFSSPFSETCPLGMGGVGLGRTWDIRL